MSAAAALPNRESLERRLDAAATELGVRLSAQQRSRLLDFVALLAKWNGTYNLTAVRDADGMLVQHVVDSLAALPALERERTGPRVLDVGSGGGLPGVVWAVADPSLDVTCVDAVGKKAAFIQQAAGVLGIPNLRGVHSRVERLANGPYDVIASRAFASLKDFVAWTAKLLAPSGVWLAMKGKRPDDEMAALPSGSEVFHVEPLAVPWLDAERCLVWIKKSSPNLAFVESRRSPNSIPSE